MKAQRTLRNTNLQFQVNNSISANSLNFSKDFRELCNFEQSIFSTTLFGNGNKIIALNDLTLQTVEYSSTVKNAR